MATLAATLGSHGVDAKLIATHGPEDSPLIRQAKDAGIEVENLRMRSMWDPLGAKRFLDLMAAWHPDIVHTRTIRADLVGRLAVKREAAVINNIVNLYPDDCLARLGPFLGRAVMTVARATSSAARLFVANAKAVAVNTAEAFGVPPDRVRVVYDGLPLERWSASAPPDLSPYGIGPENVVCLTVARLHPQKGLEDLMLAARDVLKERPDVRFVVAGDGPLRDKLTALILSEGLDGRFVLLGNRNDVPALMARAALFVLPSRFEGLPSAVIEAMAAGKAVVATRTAGLPELVEDGVTGWLVPAARPHALGREVLQALDSDLCAAGGAGRRRAEELFSDAAMARGFAAVYEAAVHA